MTLQSLLCILDGAAGESHSTDVALTLGKSHNAYIRFLHVSPDPDSYLGTFHGRIAPIETKTINTIRKEDRAYQRQAKHYVARRAKHYRIPLNAEDKLTERPSAQFEHQTGKIEPVIAHEGRLSDLIIISRSAKEMNALNDPAVLAALFDTGKPVMLVPPMHASTEPPWEEKIISLAWNGSQEAARAMYCALSLLKKAEKIYVLLARSQQNIRPSVSEETPANYLRAHGLQPTIVIVNDESRPTGEAVLAKAKELKSDLLIMGAYGHSRFRETIFGGVTRYMLEKADIPLLLSH
jgi:nucleotide-binding universal stress UspA family protein